MITLDTPQPTTQIEVEAISLPPTFPIVLPLCRRLGLAHLVNRFCPMKEGEHLTHGQVVELLVLHLLQSPHRLPLYKIEEWVAEFHLDYLYGHRAEEFNDDRIGSALDALAPAGADVETALVTRALELFRVPVQAIHWDLTSVTFSGAHEDSALLRSGYSRGRVQDRQLQVSLHVSAQGGLPLRHEVLPGNTHQAPLAPDLLRDLQQRLGRSDLIVVSDRAGISYDNVAAYRRGGAHFLGPLQVIDPEHARILAQAPAEAFRPLAYRSRNQPDDAYSYWETTLLLQGEGRRQPLPVAALLIYSARKARQDAQQRQKKLERCQARLAQIKSYLNRQRYYRRDYAARQLARAVPEALQGLLHYELTGADGQLALRWWEDPAALPQAAASEGRYLLVYDLPPGHTPDDIFELYRNQGQIEARFRHFRSDLSVQPLWLHKDERILALLQIFLFALLIYALLELGSVRAGLSTQYYHKLTAREMLYRFQGVYLKHVQVWGGPVYRELILSDEQRYILSELGFPEPTSYLQ